MAHLAPASASPGRCRCCHVLSALLHQLAAPSCALEVVHELAPAAAREGGLFADALARLRAVWQQGREDQAKIAHNAPCPACGRVRCRF